MAPVLEFFRNLPKKICAVCGKVMQEQADCYANECFECASQKFYHIKQQ
ncbi:protein YhfH [Bacillaceae bacterium]